MRWPLVIVVLVLAAATAGAEEKPLVARIVDGETDRAPKFTMAPLYPRKARRDRIEGEVEVCFDVDRKGRTRRIAVRNSSNRMFEKPSIKAVRKSTFVALRSDEPLQTMKSCRTFVFSLVPVEE